MEDYCTVGDFHFYFSICLFIYLVIFFLRKVKIKSQEGGLMPLPVKYLSGRDRGSWVVCGGVHGCVIFIACWIAISVVVGEAG